MNSVGKERAEFEPGYDPRICFVQPYAKVEFDTYNVEQYGLERGQHIGYVPIDRVGRLMP